MKTYVSFENIRPNKVFEAAKWLVANSVLFRNEGIVVNETWLQHQQLLFTDGDEHNRELGSADKSNKSNDDEWTEDENYNERLTGNLDTCLQSVDFREFNRVLCVALGENNSPLGLFNDCHSEILSFQSIFCGQKRDDNATRLVPLHYSAVCKWEMRNIDRRVALCIPNIFFKLKKLQIKQIRDKISLAIRKCKAGGRKFTAGELRTPGFVDKLTMQNDGYRVLRTLRGSPPYWEQAKRDVFSMIRQIGIPTWFCSFSAAETKWEPLLKSLAKFVQGKDLTTEEVNSLSWQEKCILIKSDPVTCTRYFDHRVQIFIRDVLKHKSNPIGEIVDFFYRVEFQQRGSPHIHMLVWIKDAPVHRVSSDTSIATFVDQYVTCNNDDTIATLINYQTHRHAKTCRKGGKDVCRFNFPLFPLPETCVLYPLEESDPCPDTDCVGKVVSVLNELHKTDTKMQFDDFLKSIEMDYAKYVHIIRSTLQRPKLFLKRSVDESRINNYNSLLMKCWKANMDLQYVLDPYSCVSYIVSYISKGQRGLSNLLMEACAEAQEFDSDIRQQVRRIGNQFLSSVEIGAQEAVYLVLQMPLRRCSRTVIYVDTKLPDARTSLIKPISELQELPEDCCDREMDNVLKRYKRRPKSMEEMCYADFASWYDLCTAPKKIKSVHMTDVELPETEYEHDKVDNIEVDDDNAYGKVVKFPCGTCVRRRLKQKVIYTCITPINEDVEEHCRQQLMLYSSWRDEEIDLIRGFETFQGSYRAKEGEITFNRLQYERCAVDECELVLDNDSSGVSTVNPENQHQELVDINEGTSKPAELSCFDPGAGEMNPDVYDLGGDLGSGSRIAYEGILPHREMDNEPYLESVRQLNYEQKKFFYYILHRVKVTDLPFHTFLSGGAGVGKTAVTRCIYQALLKYFNHKRSENPNSEKLLLCAPTGKAAHNIGGKTVHAAFCIPANQGFHFKPLDMQQLNSMRACYQDLKVVIIDEISMVGRSMFNFINLRLQEVMGCTRPFGNVSILAVGDLYQLKPVMDSWVFSQVFKTPQLHCLATNLWVDLFELYELKVVMGQKNDQEFAKLLNRLREGLHTEDDLSVLRNRQVENLIECSVTKNLPHLFCKRFDANLHNQSVMADVVFSSKVCIEAIDDISGDFSQTIRQTILSKIPDDPSKTLGLQKHLTLGIGLPAEICLNVDTGDGLTNGASCKIRKFDFRVPQSSRCSIVWVEFDDESIGRKWRLRYKHLYCQDIPVSWTPILETCRKFTFQYYKTYLIARRQFPLYISAGKTIHKAQGSTIQEAVIHFGTRTIDHIHYVGLSRVTSLSGVHILELNSSKISVSSDVEAEMDRLRTERCINDTLPSLQCFNNRVMKVCFHNCRSLQKHFHDFSQESNLLSADVIGLAETRLPNEVGDGYEIDGFQMFTTVSEQAVHGLAIYYRNSLSFKYLAARTVCDIEYVLFQLSEVIIGYVYCPPQRASVERLTNFLSAISADIEKNCDSSVPKKLILMGDYNFEYTENGTCSQMFRIFLGLKQLVRCATTDYDSCIDHIYTNVSDVQVKASGTLESYYSDHKPLFLVFSET